MPSSLFQLEQLTGIRLLRLCSDDATNRLTRACVLALIDVVHELRRKPEALIITGNQKFFSAGADLAEIAALTGPAHTNSLR